MGDFADVVMEAAKKRPPLLKGEHRILGEVTLKDAKGDVFAEVHKDDAAGTVIGAESVIIIKNAKGKEVVRITRGYVTVKNFNVEEIVNNLADVNKLDEEMSLKNL